MDALARLVARARARARRPRRTVGVGIPGALSPATGPGARTRTPSGSTAGRWRATWSARSAGRCAWRTTRTASRSPRRTTARPRGAGRLRRHPGHGRRRRDRRRRPVPRRPQRASPANGATTRCPGRATDEWPGPPCYCGQRGCIETFLSGPGSRARSRGTGDARDRAGDRGARPTPGDARAAGDARALRGPAGPRARRRGQRARPRRDRARRRLVEHGAPLRRRAGALAGRVFSDAVATRLLPPVHGDSSGVRGAAWLGAGARSPRLMGATAAGPV